MTDKERFLSVYTPQEGSSRGVGGLNKMQLLIGFILGVAAFWIYKLYRWRKLNKQIEKMQQKKLSDIE